MYTTPDPLSAGDSCSRREQPGFRSERMQTIEAPFCRFLSKGLRRLSGATEHAADAGPSTPQTILPLCPVPV